MPLNVRLRGRSRAEPRPGQGARSRAPACSGAPASGLSTGVDSPNPEGFGGRCPRPRGPVQPPRTAARTGEWDMGGQSISIARTAQRNVKNWKDAAMARSWTTAGMLVAEGKLRRWRASAPAPSRRGVRLDGHHDLRPNPAEPLGVQVLDELGQRNLPRLLPVVVQRAELGRVQPKLAGHLHVGVGEPVPCSCVDPSLPPRWENLRLCHISRPSDGTPRSIACRLAPASARGDPAPGSPAGTRPAGKWRRCRRGRSVDALDGDLDPRPS